MSNIHAINLFWPAKKFHSVQENKLFTRINSRIRENWSQKGEYTYIHIQWCWNNRKQADIQSAQMEYDNLWLTIKNVQFFELSTIYITRKFSLRKKWTWEAVIRFVNEKWYYKFWKIFPLTLFRNVKLLS